ncbi:MAG: ferredoxin Fer [Haloferacaceae archaeon]
MDAPFEVLGLDPDADDEAIKEAYKRRVKDAHPDHGGSAEEFQRVRAAYEAIAAGEPAGAASPDGPGTGGTGDGRWNPEPEPEPDPEPTVEVEYLDYDVLADHGWDLDDADLFERAAAADLDPADHGRVEVDPEGYLLEGVEDDGRTWPYACRGGACANCAVAVLAGELSMPVDHILPDELLDRGIRLSCVGTPTTDELKVVYNVKHLPDLDDLRLPPYPFERSASGD